MHQAKSLPQADSLARKYQKTEQPVDNDKHEEYQFGSNYEVGDCLLSNYQTDTDNNCLSEDQDQYEIIKDQIQTRLDMISDLKTLNQVQQLSDEQILGMDIEQFKEKFCGESVKAPPNEIEGDQHESEGYDEEDDDDDFEQELEKFVPFDKKREFAEQVKHCTNECLIDIIKNLFENILSCLENYGNSRLQLNFDLIERDAFLKCYEIYQKYNLNPASWGDGLKRQRTDENLDSQDNFDSSHHANLLDASPVL